MILIIEGNDCSGKSSLSKLIASKTKYCYIKEKYKQTYNFKKEPDKWRYFVAGWVVQTLNVFSTFNWFIKDRFHLSEYAYSKYYNRPSHIDFNKVEKELLKQKDNIFLIYLDISYNTYIQRLRREKEIVVFNSFEFDGIRKDFDESFQKSQLNKIFLNTNNSSNLEIYQKLKFIPGF